jgi:hypothetical protein
METPPNFSLESHRARTKCQHGLIWLEADLGYIIGVVHSLLTTYFHDILRGSNLELPTIWSHRLEGQ